VGYITLLRSGESTSGTVNANRALDVWPYLLERMIWGKFLGRMSEQTLL
jgi:hypothetical protein